MKQTWIATFAMLIFTSIVLCFAFITRWIFKLNDALTIAVMIIATTFFLWAFVIQNINLILQYIHPLVQSIDQLLKSAVKYQARKG